MQRSGECTFDAFGPAGDHRRRVAARCAPPRVQRRRLLRVLAGTAGAAGSALAAACRSGAGGDPRLRSTAPLAVSPAPTPTAGTYRPIRFPEDEAPHDVLTEWWYYTGHLAPEEPAAAGGAAEWPAGEEYGFQLVFFRSVRAGRPPGYAAHFAVTDVGRRRFRYDQRGDVAPAEPAAPARAGGAGGDGGRPAGVVSFGPPAGGFDLALGDWRLRGGDGRDALAATLPGYALRADLAALRPPALHAGTPPLPPGVVSLGAAGVSYYYSRTRLALTGTLTVDGDAPLPVRGLARMDHQWGDFVALGWGGWDWFGGYLADGRDLILAAVRDPGGATRLLQGTLVDAAGTAHPLPADGVALEATGAWTSPRSGVRYPSGWRVRLPAAGLDLLWEPLLEDQELDTRRTTGVVYWEGALRLRDATTGADAGRGYVELTGYSAQR
jgi:predicted secreted hydrolase